MTRVPSFAPIVEESFPPLGGVIYSVSVIAGALILTLIAGCTSSSRPCPQSRASVVVEEIQGGVSVTMMVSGPNAYAEYQPAPHGEAP